MWEVDKNDGDKKWENLGSRRQTDKLQGKVPSSAEMIWMGYGKKQPDINSHRLQMEGEVKVCLTWKKALSGKHDTEYGLINGGAVL